MPLACAYYTYQYKAHADRLIESLDALRIQHSICELPSSDTWKHNAHWRPLFLLQQLMQHRMPLLSLDVDCIVRNDPTAYIPPGNYDFAFYTHHQPSSGRPEPLPGTLVVNHTEGAIHGLARWAVLNVLHSERNDRENFAEMVAGCVNAELPVEMCFIFDTHKTMFPNVKPVIEHFQASRQMRRAI